MSARRWIWFAPLLLVLASGCRRQAAGAGTASASAGENAEIPALTVQDVAAKMARHEPLAVFDTNSQERYRSGHVPGSRWLAFNAVHASDLPQDHATPLVFYCHNEH